MFSHMLAQVWQLLFQILDYFDFFFKSKFETTRVQFIIYKNVKWLLLLDSFLQLDEIFHSMHGICLDPMKKDVFLAMQNYFG